MFGCVNYMTLFDEKFAYAVINILVSSLVAYKRATYQLGITIAKVNVDFTKDAVK